MTMIVAPLPLYPSTKAQQALSAAQLAKVHQTISASLSQVLDLPQEKQDAVAAGNFISSVRRSE
jgi:activating signal cointegrator complex subunit 2